jgi:virulence-associated protein VagC
MTDDRAALLGFWGVVISALITSLVQVVPSDRDSGPQLRPAEPAVGAVRVHVHGQGAWLYLEPSTQSISRFHLLDGQTVDVVCQRREAEIVDEPNPERGQLAQWPVWNRLLNGLWLPDRWTSLPKVPGDTPQGCLPTC